MESYSQRESVLLGYKNPQRSFINPSSSPKSQHGNSGFDFSDVFGGPPRRSSLQEMRYSCGETTDSYALRNVNDDDDASLIHRRWSGLNEKPVFGDEDVNRRRHISSDFFDDIFRGNETLNSSPRKHDRDSIYSTPGSRVLSPVRPLPPKAEPFASSSSPVQFSPPAKLIKGTDLPTFVSSTCDHQKKKDGASNGTDYYSYASLSRFSGQVNQVQEELRYDACCQSSISLSQELSLRSEESSNLAKHDETDRGSNLKRDSNSSEVSSSGSQFHFSIYKWSTKGIPFAIPLRGGNKSTLKEKCKLQRCSSANGWIACKDIATETPKEIPNDIDTPSLISRMPSDANSFGMELDKQENGSLFKTSMKYRAEQCQTVEDETLPKYESETPSTHQRIVKDIPGSTIFQNSREGTKSHLALDAGLSEKTEEEIPVVTQKAQKTQLKSLRSLLFDNDNEQDVLSVTSNYEQHVDEVTRKNELKESKVKSIKKLSAVFVVDENMEARDGKRSTLNNEVDKANFQCSPLKSQDNLGKNGVRGKVKEFVKIFNQEASNKPKFDVDSQRHCSRRKERSKLRTEDEASVTTTKTDGKRHLPNVNKNNTPDASTMVDEYLKQSNKQHPQTRIKNPSIPNGSEAIIGYVDESFHGSFLITEIPQDGDKLPQTGNNHEEIQVIDTKIQMWSNEKEGNIRSLLSTLQYVLWADSGWKPVPLVDIIEGNAVKKSYQKALLCLHPDKLLQKGATSHQKYIAEKVFDILQEAWTHFNSIGSV